MVVVVREIFPEHIISMRVELPWPARSPDLSVCDCLLCGHLKEKVYTTRPRTIDDLKTGIRKQISAIPGNMARRALENLQARLEEYERNDGQQLSDVLLKTKSTET
jgi:hypothetical protein